MDVSNTKKKTTLRRRAATLIAIVLTAALILSGTYAWYTTQDAVNVLRAPGGDRSVLLHDDFTGGPDKRIYVENTGDKADVYVRIKLQEYMDLTSWADRDPEGSDWQTHIPQGDDAHICNFTNPALASYHDNFTWVMGGKAYYVPSPLWETGVMSNPDVEESTEGAIPTPDAAVITMASYKSFTILEKIEFIGWVYDSDGWAYWSQPLAPGNATGLLLASVTPDPPLSDIDYFYAINVILEAVDKSDLAMWIVPSGNNDGFGKPSVKTDALSLAQLATNDAVEMLEMLSGKTVLISKIEVEIQPIKTKYIPDETFNSAGMEIKVTKTDGSHEFITSGFNYNPSGALPMDTTHVTISYGGASVTVPILVHPLVDLHLKAPNTAVNIDGIDWEVVTTQKLDDGRDYVMLMTVSNNSSVSWQSLYDNKMQDYYLGTISQCPTLRESIVVPDIVATSTGNVTSNDFLPSKTLAKDSPNTTWIVLLMDALQAQKITNANGWYPGTSKPWWCFSYDSTGTSYCYSSDGTYKLVSRATTGIGYRPCIWVQIP